MILVGKFLLTLLFSFHCRNNVNFLTGKCDHFCGYCCCSNRFHYVIGYGFIEVSKLYSGNVQAINDTPSVPRKFAAAKQMFRFVFLRRFLVADTWRVVRGTCSSLSIYTETRWHGVAQSGGSALGPVTGKRLVTAMQENRKGYSPWRLSAWVALPLPVAVGC